jgi:hypothetical protein
MTVSDQLSPENVNVHEFARLRLWRFHRRDMAIQFVLISVARRWNDGGREEYCLDVA